MYLLRRTAFKALSCSSGSIAVKPRAYTTFAQLSRTKPQWAVPSFQRRFASDEITGDGEAVSKPASADVEGQSTVASAISSAAETSTQAADAAEAALDSAAESAEQAQEAAAAPVANPFSNLPPPSDVREPGSASRALEPSKTLYVGNLFFESTEQALRREFSQFGEVSNVKIIYDHRGLSKGFGYIEFVKQEDANEAIANLDQKVFDGRRITVQYHRRRDSNAISRPRSQAADPSKTLFIGNMSFEMSDKDLNDLFHEIRNVLDVRVAIDRRSGQPRGFAHADFIDVESAVRAREVLMGKEIYGRRLRVDFSTSTSASNTGRPSQQR